ncbi:MAG TPA: biotin--[acetyl-CoA-carboxylase] ligase [Burkholderiales bacterium]|nr:biotin--[acetyl-CoA-carboxylase] ligase [Burkholderiales bacterium]
MNALTFDTLRMLADGEFRSGEAMARVLGVSRASIWNSLSALDDAGIEVFKVRGRGYRLAQPLELIAPDDVRLALGAAASRFQIEVVDRIESTNTALMHRAANGAASGSVIAAEWQTAGRGRRGRQWHALPGAALTFSLLWRFEQGAGFLAGLSLAVGVALIRTLQQHGVHDAGLKWPNDVLWRGRKLAGILIEMHGDMLGPSAAVIGIGLNCRMPAALLERIDQPAVDFATAAGAAPDRSCLLASLLIELDRVCSEFAHAGFAPIRAEWQKHDVYHNRSVQIALPDGSVVNGKAAGIAENGAFVLATSGGKLNFHSGDVSLRAAS